MFNGKLIGVKGKRGSGKTTVCKYCKKYGFSEYNIADPLKDICRILFDFTDEQLYGETKEVFDPNWNSTPREVLQKFGTELFKEKIKEVLPNLDIGVYDNIWLKKFERFLEKNSNSNFIVGDIRFLSEEKFIRDHGGIIVEVWTKSTQNPSDASNPSFLQNDISTQFSSHKSETEQDLIKADYSIYNAKDSLDTFYEQIEALFSKIL